MKTENLNSKKQFWSNFICSCLFTVLLPFSLFAQNDTLKLSVQQAIDLGLKNRYDVQSHQLNTDIASNTTNNKTKEWLPTISATGNLRYNTQLQQSVLPTGLSGAAGEQRIAFGTKNQTSLSLDLDQPLFKPGITDDIKLAKNNQLTEKEKFKSKQDDVKLEIAEAYLNVVLKELQLRIASEDQNRFQSYLLLAEGKFKQNVLIESDYLSAKLDYENSKISYTNALQSYQLSMENFKYKTNVPESNAILLTDKIENIVLEESISTNQESVNNRTELKQLLLKQDENDLLLKKYRKNSLPSLSIVGNYTTQFQYNSFNYLNNRWSPYNFVGLRLSVPISDHLKNSNTIKEYKFKKTQYELDVKQKTSDLNYELSKTLTELKNARGNLQNSLSTYELSKKVDTLQQKEFELGTLTFSDLFEKEKSLATAEQNYLTAVYTYLIANLNYKATIGEDKSYQSF